MAQTCLQVPLQSLQLQIHEALHRAEGLQQQLNAIQTRSPLHATAAMAPHSNAPEWLSHTCEGSRVVAAAHAALSVAQNGIGDCSTSGEQSGAGAQSASGTDAESVHKFPTTHCGAGMHGVQHEWTAPAEANGVGAVMHHSKHPSPTRCFWRRINPGAEVSSLQSSAMVLLAGPETY